jgi:hypothetical protein
MTAAFFASLLFAQAPAVTPEPQPKPAGSSAPTPAKTRNKAGPEMVPMPFARGLLKRPTRPAGGAPADTGIPRTPKGLPQCNAPLKVSADLPRGAGEAIRYLIDVDGISVGTVDFKIERRGSFEGRAATEYRSLFKLDALVAAFLPVDGRAATVVPDSGAVPTRAMDRYLLDRDSFEEELSFAADGRTLTIKRSKNGETKNEKRVFKEPVMDFVTGFYLVRALPKGMDGCAIIYGNQRAYTVWLKPDGKEKVKTPVGLREADRYIVRYASEKSPRPYDARMWIGDAPSRLPFRAEILGPHTLEAQIQIYDTGK